MNIRSVVSIFTFTIKRFVKIILKFNDYGYKNLAWSRFCFPKKIKTIALRE